jgi:hypothetical protein
MRLVTLIPQQPHRHPGKREDVMIEVVLISVAFSAGFFFGAVWAARPANHDED